MSLIVKIGNQSFMVTELRAWLSVQKCHVLSLFLTGNEKGLALGWISTNVNKWRTCVSTSTF